MNIVNFFNNSKKRDLSDNSKSDAAEYSKKLREECSGSREADAGDVFLKGSTIQAVVIFYLTASRS